MAIGHAATRSGSATGTLGPFTFSILGAIVSAFFLARYLPHIPYANRLMLKPHEETDEFGEELNDSIHPEMAALHREQSAWRRRRCGRPARCNSARILLMSSPKAAMFYQEAGSRSSKLRATASSSRKCEKVVWILQQFA